MSDAIFTRLRALLGTTGVERDGDGVPRATPDTPDALTLVCRLAHEEGWKIRVEGRGTWLPSDAPADLAVSTRGLEQIVSVSPADLVATVQAGTSLEALRRRLADYGMWLALDPPGRPERSIGSVIATATAGPLRQGFGPVRDHVLGCTVATGDGRLVNAGGRVVKNVAGYDLTKLQVGGFGGFGIIAEIHLRLRALPRADVTLLARGPRDELTSGRESCWPLTCSPAPWSFCRPRSPRKPTGSLPRASLEPTHRCRQTSGDSALQASSSGNPFRPTGPRRSGVWPPEGVLGGPITLRLGVLGDGVDDTIDLLAHDLDEGLVSAGAGQGVGFSNSITPGAMTALAA